MKKLVSRADIITPNLTEFCLLTDTDYKAFQNTSLNMEDIITKIQTASLALTENHQKKIIITGIHFTDETGIHKIGNLLIDNDIYHLSSCPCCSGSYSGTGDLFASCITGGLARGDSLTDTMQTAGKFLEQALIDSSKERVPVNDGVNFEKFLCLLM